ncbi:MAG: alpha/beta fold hydrolase [Chloroflexi bacterium]|nr:alpha/beta fold hydrolase [Chloroflexota bacterium]
MSTYVLIHGAYHGGWCWDKVVPLLEAAGHKAVAPDLPSHGQDRTPIGEVTLDAYARRACEVAGAQGEPVILVGHSMGGRVITQAAEYCPGSINTLVYLTAALLKSGKSQVPDSPQRSNAERAASGIVSKDGVYRTIRPELAKDIFYFDCSDEDVERAKSLVCPQSIEASGAPMRTTDANFGRVPRVYIECLQDKAIPIDAQRAMYAALPCKQVFTMDTSHSPFLSAPEELVGHLLSLSAN